MKMKAAVTPAESAPFEIEEVELQEPQTNEVLIKVVASGVCHTDAVARDQEAPTPLPAVLGHEGSGIIEKVGPGVKSVEEGDHVVLSYVSCGQCENCLQGNIAYCERMTPLNFGGKMLDGSQRLSKDGEHLSSFFGQSSFGMYAVANERNVVKVDKDIDLAVLGPLGCGIQTGSGTVLNKLKPQFGETIAVYGCGAVGLSAIMGARLTGVSKIMAVDVHDSRLELAKELGATHTFNGSEVDVVEEINKETDGGTHYAVETTGAAKVTRQSLQALRPMGTSAVVGMTQDMSFNVFDDVMAEGKSLSGAIEGESIPQIFIPRLIDFYKKGKFPFDRLVKYYNLEDINQAFDDSANGSTVKPIVKMDHA
ncbi:NAD(P)-dependent alcohol dehydrogenase [Salibacterium lacus]|uniref:NAD(P)-dependent alcohol dehydrogenase n=1 Tax=Salibacterium lacus TaxID=1898109 RepID=A0ABW5T3B4_9BACI